MSSPEGGCRMPDAVSVDPKTAKQPHAQTVSAVFGRSVGGKMNWNPVKRSGEDKYA
jgi:hypothetical protein